jgi:hypothetical protein
MQLNPAVERHVTIRGGTSALDAIIHRPVSPARYGKILEGLSAEAAALNLPLGRVVALRGVAQ